MTEAKSIAVDFDPFAQGEIARTAPLTPPQRELWSAIKLGGEAANCAYNEGLAFVLRGALDEAALTRALAKLVSRHESLRATFSADGESMLFSELGSLVPQRLDVRDLDDREARYAGLLEASVSVPFDLEHGPLVRAVLVSMADDDHRLLLIAHHIVCDGWSHGVLVSELAALYGAETTQQSAALEPSESYAEYAEQRAREALSSEAKQALSYWLDQYEGGVPTLELPLDRPRPALRTYTANRLEHELARELVAPLRALAKSHHATLLQLLLTGFQTTLARVTGHWDLVVGLPAAGQASSGRLGLVGHAVSYLPVRVKLDPTLSFSAALQRTKVAMGGALDHQEVTFGTLLQNLPIARDPSRVPLAPVCFNLEQDVQGVFAGLESSVRGIARTFEVFEIFANVVDRKTSFALEVQYNCDLFDGDTIRDWLKSYEAVLSSALRAPDTTLAHLSVLTPKLRTRVLDAFNDTRTSYEHETPIHGFFEQQVARVPEHKALVFEGQHVSYQELDARANRLASYLRKRGVGPEQIVGVCVKRSIDMVVAQLGVLKAGAAYLPLDPSYPPERLRHMLDDSGATLIVTEQASARALGEHDKPRVLLDSERTELEREPATRVESGVRPEQVAYVIYTSGSTGKPKGVLVEHRNFANFLAGMDARLTLAPAGVWLCATSIGFDISLLELFGALGRGFTVVLHSDESSTEHGLSALFEKHAVTHFQCTPSQAMLLVSEPQGERAIASLRELLLGGEALPLDLAKRLVTLLARQSATSDAGAEHGRLINMYGPTETTIWSTTQEVRELDRSVPIGAPIANTRVYVLDAHGEPCARGAVGELHIGGAGVTRGYHRRPELTRERFVADPFAGNSEARMYKTGDLARFRADGAVEFLGRNDHQVKLRGYRIELGEIEVALRAHESVREAAVVAREDRPGDKRLVAYLVCNGEPTVQALKAFLTHAGLPDYMLPQAFVTLPKLPSTPNGKLNRNALPAPEQQASLSVGKYVAASDELEQSIADGWRSVLRLSRVGVEDNFFDLGGHSLLVVKLAQELTQRTGKSIAVPDLFRFPTVKSLAGYLRSGATVQSGSAERAAERRASDRRVTGRRG